MPTFYYLDNAGFRAYPQLGVLEADTVEQAQAFLDTEVAYDGSCLLLTPEQLGELMRQPPLHAPKEEPLVAEKLFTRELSRQPDMEFYPAWTQEENDDDYGHHHPILCETTYPFQLKVPRDVQGLLLLMLELREVWQARQSLPALRRKAADLWDCSVWEIQQDGTQHKYLQITQTVPPAQALEQLRAWATVQAL